MESILQVIKYLFKKENIPATEKVFNNFFGNGISFPQLVALAYGIDEIPDFDPNPKSPLQRSENNKKAYQYLSIKNPEILRVAPNYSTKENQYKLLSFIVVQNCFEIDGNEILDKCNKITQSLNLKYKTKNELANENFLLVLLSAITNGKVQITSKHKNNYNMTKQAFKKAKVPFIIDKSSSEPENKYLFFIQIEIIFDIFSEEIEHLLDILAKNQKKSKDKKAKNQKRKTKNTDFLDFEVDDIDDMNFLNSDDSNGDEISKSQNSTNDFISDQDSFDDIKNFFTSDINSSIDSFQSVNNSFDRIFNDSPLKISEYNYSTILSSDINDSKESFTEINYSKDSFSDNIKLNDSVDSILSSSDILNKRKRKRAKSSYKPENDSFYLLEIINIICKDAGIHLDNFEQAIEDKNLKIFLLHIFKDDKMKQASINQIFDSAENLEFEILDDVIHYLGTIEPKFNVLVFDFENSEFCVPSTILLYTNVLNFFFLKESKQKLFERVYTILRYKDGLRRRIEGEEYKMLSRIETYTKLQDFILTGFKQTNENENAQKVENENTQKVKNENDQKVKNVNDVGMNNADFPLVLDEIYLNECVREYDIPSTVYFQLQIMFNYFDEKSTKFHVLELFLIALRRFKKIIVPPAFRMVRSIRAKNISLILQMRRNKIYEQKKENKNAETEDESIKTNIKEAEDESENANKMEIDNKNENSKNKNETDDEYDEEENNNFNDFNKLPYFRTFLERSQKQYSIKLLKKENTTNSVELLPAETFWNLPKTNYLFKNGVLINKNGNENFWGKWSKVLNSKKKKKQIKTLKPSQHVNIRSNCLSPNKFKTLGASDSENPYFDTLLNIDENSRLYELFVFDENENKWHFNQDEFELLKKTILINPHNKMPLILFINSNEDDSMEICYHLNKFCFPKESEKIVIYGSCNRNLSYFNMKNKSNETELIWPLFLFLHVPESKHDKENISTIIFQIFSFLFFIQNMVICVLNPNQLDQIDFQKKLIEIINSFQFKHKDEFKESFKKGSSLKYTNSIKNFDDFEEDDDNEETDNNDFYETDEKIDLMYRLNLEYFNKPFKYICLINDENIESKSGTNFFEKELTNKIKNKKILIQSHFIDIKDPTTYGPFLKALNEYSISNSFVVKEIEIIFSFLPLFELSSTYINFKQDEENLEKNLSTKVNERFDMLKNNCEQNNNDFTIMANLQKEMRSTFPLLDSSYDEICNLILLRKKEKN